MEITEGASINVTNWEDAVSGLAFIKEYSRRIIVEKFITGFFRILVIDNKLVAAAKRVPAHVIGNGQNSIEELIATENLDPRRGYGHENVLTQIDVTVTQRFTRKTKLYFIYNSKIRRSCILKIYT
jgi:cyanophycin synthetase